jgi:hypothetical protein
MSGDDLAGRIDQDWRHETEAIDRPRELLNLSFWMDSRVARVGLQSRDIPPLHASLMTCGHDSPHCLGRGQASLKAFIFFGF